MPFINYLQQAPQQVWEGITGAINHSEQLSFGYFTIQKGAVLPAHAHVHEQWTHIISGEFLMNIEGEEAILKPGMAAYIPPNAVHSGMAITEVVAIDCFTPVREDFKNLPFAHPED